MWIGGVRVIVMDDKNRMLMVCQHHEDRDIWMVPGGGIEEGESSLEAAVRDCVESEEAVKTGAVSDILSVELLIVKYSQKLPQ